MGDLAICEGRRAPLICRAPAANSGSFPSYVRRFAKFIRGRLASESRAFAAAFPSPADDVWNLTGAALFARRRARRFPVDAPPRRPRYYETPFGPPTVTATCLTIARHEADLTATTIGCRVTPRADARAVSVPKTRIAPAR